MLRDGEKTLLISLLGLGDIVMATPAIRFLTERRPATSFGFLGPQGLSEVLAAFPRLDALHGFAKGGSWWQAWRRVAALKSEVRAAGYRQAVIFGDYRELRRWLAAAGIADGDIHSLAFVERDGDAQHLSAQFFRFARGLVPDAAEAEAGPPRIFPREEDQARADELLRPLDGAEFIAAHIGNSTFRRRRFALGGSRISHRAWPLENWRRCLPLLVEELDRPLVLTGSAKEGAIADQLLAEVAPGVRARITNIAGHTPPLALAAVLGRAAAFIGADTGPTHIAAAMEVPIAVLIGPTDPGVSGPVVADPARLRVLRKPVHCSPCGRKVRKKCTDNICLRNLPAEQVVAAVGELLSPRR